MQAFIICFPCRQLWAWKRRELDGAFFYPSKSKCWAAKAFSELIRRPAPLSREMDFSFFNAALFYILSYGKLLFESVWQAVKTPLAIAPSKSATSQSCLAKLFLPHSPSGMNPPEGKTWPRSRNKMGLAQSTEGLEMVQKNAREV